MSTENTVHTSGVTVLLAFLTGAAAGAVIALLTAPRSGRETRERIRDIALTAGDQAGKVPGGLREAYARATEAAKQSFDQALK